MKLAAIILAAGYSTRMVDFKPLLKIGEKTVIRRCTDLFWDSGVEQTIVVTGHRDDEVRNVLNSSTTCVFNPDFNDGMYSSICRGVQTITKNVDGFFLLPVDIPLIRLATIELLHTHFNGSEVLYPCFDDRRGHPPLIPADHIPEILSYNGDGGLKKLLRTFASRNIPVWDRTVLMDMDTRENYTGLKRFHATMDIGTREEGLALAKISLPPKVFAHGKAVAEIAVKLGAALAGRNITLNSDILHNGGLLHDIAKGQPNHEQAGAELVEHLGLPGLARCIQMHRDCVMPLDGKLAEAEIVCLADKLVKGARPVTVRQRFEQKLEINKDDKEACRLIKRKRTNSLQLQQQVEKLCGHPIDLILGR